MTAEIIIDTITQYVRRSNPKALEGANGIADLPVHTVFDSIAMIEFLAFLEQTFQVRISDADVLPQNFETFAAVGRLIERKKTEG
jgi:acyl carrier protein